MTAAFEIDLDVFRGPLDLLVYLVRRHEVAPDEVSLRAIAEQFLERLDAAGGPSSIDAAGEFLDLTSLLLELKARAVLPADPSEEDEGAVPDVRDELVRRLLEYRQFRDGATILAERSARWQDRVARQAPDPHDWSVAPGEQAIGELELWDLVSAHGRLVREQRRAGPASIVYDDTPIHVYIRRLHGLISARGPITLDEAFDVGMPKSAMIGIFLAVLELSRHHGVLLDQADGDLAITLRPGPNFAGALTAVASDFDAETVDGPANGGPALASDI